MMEKTNKTGVYLLLAVTSAVWGFQPVCLKWLLPYWNPVTITTVRLFVFSLILIAVALYQEGRRSIPQGKLWWWLAALGMFYMLNNVLQFTGIRYTTVGNTTLICALNPVFTAVLAVLVMRERLSPVSWAGIVISFFGSLLVITDGRPELLLGIDFNRGDLFCFSAQVSWAFHSLVSIVVLKKMAVLPATGWSVLISSFLTGGYGWAAGELAVAELPAVAFWSLMMLIFVGGIFAMLSWNYGIKIAGASRATNFLNIMPVVGMLSGWWLLGEAITVAKTIGALAIFLGVYLTTHGN